MFKKYEPRLTPDLCPSKTSTDRRSRRVQCNETSEVLLNTLSPAKILEQYPLLEEYIEDILPKKTPIFITKWYSITIYVVWTE